VVLFSTLFPAEEKAKLYLIASRTSYLVEAVSSSVTHLQSQVPLCFEGKVFAPVMNIPLIGMQRVSTDKMAPGFGCEKLETSNGFCV
jgi:hypothetical protein